MLRGKGLLTPLQNSFIAEFAALPEQAQFRDLALQLMARVTSDKPEA